MQRILRQVLRAALLPILALMAVAISPIGGVASAASASPNTCQTIIGEGGPYFACHLEISAPTEVLAGQPFTVQVEVMTGYEPEIVARSDSCAAKVGVALDVYASTEGLTVDKTYFARAVGGVATFHVSGLPTGNWSESLHAYVGYPNEGDWPPCLDNYYISDGWAGITVNDIQEGQQPIAPCPANVVCEQTTSGSGSAATLYADEGTFDFAYFEPYDGNGCNASGPLDPNGVLNFKYTGSSFKTIIFALSPFLITKGIGQYNICWQSNFPFKVVGGGDAILNETTGYYVGDLPNCSTKVVAPCVLFRTSDQYNAGYFGVLAPPTDPKGYPY